MVHRLNRLRHRDDGAVAVIVALLMSTVFIGLCALVVDLGMARDTRGQAQNAADASALAAGNVLYPNGSVNFTNAIAAAKSYATTNYGVSAADWSACTDASALTYHPDTACISFNSATSPTAVRVNIPTRKVNTPFAGIWGVRNVPVGASAQITLTPSGSAPCGLCVIGNVSNIVNNDAQITINGANIDINGSLTIQGSGSVTAPGSNIYLEGTPTVNNGGYIQPGWMLKPTAYLGQDPLANLPMPSGYSATTTGSNSCTGGPGTYTSLTACTINNNGGIGMRPGLYVLLGSTTLNDGANQFTVATGVTLYFLNSGLTISNGSGLNITAPTTGATKGLAIVFARNNSSGISFSTAQNIIKGTIYIPDGPYNVINGASATASNSLIVANSLSLNGGAPFIDNFTQAANVATGSSSMYLSK
jgi:Flp pilus assembly protein TadG